MRLSGEGGRECETAAGLDHQEARDYVSGSEVRHSALCLPHFLSSVLHFAPQLLFDGSPDSGLSDGLTACYMAELGGAVTGGSVTWLGEGILATRSVSQLAPPSNCGRVLLV